MKKEGRISMFFEKVSNRATLAVGSSTAFISAFFFVLVWLISGIFFNFSDTWQLIINTATTIVTFLMVFLIQKTQNKDALAIQLKLNELVAASERASNRMVNIEDMTEEELRVLQKYYGRMASLAQKESDIHKSHSIDQAEKKQREKAGKNR
jgi:low affinity Fe/Cu permease